MKFAFTIVILTCWSKLSIASDDYVAPEFLDYVDYVDPQFVDHVDETKLHCLDNILSVNFSNAVITQIGRDFISSHLITCLDLSHNQIETIADGAFNKLPRLTELYLSNNKLVSAQNLFTFGGHETLKILILNDAVKTSSNFNITIPGSYPNLEILSVRKNGFSDIIASTETPLPKLKILDLSGNHMKSNGFVNLLPESLEYLYLQDNSLPYVRSLNKGNNITTLTLDNNRLLYLMDHSDNPAIVGVQLYALQNLRYFSIVGCNIVDVALDAFKSPTNLVYLNMSNNVIDSLHTETFAELKSLETLDLSRNRLLTIINISAVINITTLSLGCNKIRSVPEYAFKQMPELRELSLDGNLIEEVDINGFAYLYHLEKLDLCNNELSFLPEGWADAFGSLQFLDLSGNQFTSLESLSLSNTLPLVDVYLTMNPLKYLDADSFKNLPKNVTVDLVHKLHESITRC